ncbi:MAG: T9SS type A sorting domain-containing protein [Sphingobacteriales bacterium]|nr:T9SS type A sorting domain-containing protein [Sphingobacteriales bacterium]
MIRLYKNGAFGILMLFLMTLPQHLFGQMYNDGGLRLRVWAHKVWSAANCGDIGDQEYNIQDIQARVRDAAGTGYITSPSGFNAAFWGAENRFYSFNPNQMNNVNSAGLPLEAEGYKMLDITYSGSQVPVEFQVYLGKAFEDDCYGDILSCYQGAPRQYDECCCLFGVCALGDDYFAGSAGWTAVNFRGGNNGAVSYTLPVMLSSGGEHRYAVVFAYRWDWSPALKPLCASLPNYKDGNITVTADLVGVFNDMDWDGGTCGIAIGGAEDLRVKVLAKDNITAGFPSFPTGPGSAVKISQDVPGYNTFAAVNIFNKTYTTETNFSALNLAWDLFEEDGFYLSILGFGISCGTDDNYEGSDYSFPWFCINSDDAHNVTRTGGPGGTVNTGYTINWRDSPPNTYNYVEVPAVISGSSYRNWMLKIRYRWTISAPTVSIVTTDLHACRGTTQSLTATTANATYFQWQVADINGSGTGNCPAGANWTNVSGAICPTITFPQTLGTRTYRLIVYNRNGSGSTTSSGSRYDSAVSNCVRVTYFPYTPPIVSTACGRSVPSGNAVNFSVPAIPALNAIGDALAGWQYNWSISPTTNVAPTSATNSSTFSPTFAAAAAGTTYTVTLTVVDPCGAISDSTTTCTFTVTTPSCDLLYVAPAANGGNDGNAGTATSPYDTITNPLANISGSRNHIRIMGGATYSETQWLLPANAIIDGGWEIVNLALGEWRKNSSLTTTVNLNPGTQNNGSVGYHRGIISNGNSWLLQDLTVNVKVSTPATGQYLNKGYTVYGFYINGNTGWEIKRSTINAGPGSTGAAGTTPSGSGGSGVGGGAGGGGGNGSTSACGCGAWGTSSGGLGTSGNGGASGGTGGGNCCGTGCNVAGCDANGCYAGNGNPGNGGGVGSTNWAGGNRPASPGVASPYFIPAGQSASGSNGFGGGGGGGGGGGDYGTCCTCSPCPSGFYYGVTGGRGGHGGLPGSGGWGGGGSFGIYIVGNAAGTLSQSVFNAGAVGLGGNGAVGQPGETGLGPYSGGGSGGCNGSQGSGGGGGKGGNGGPGGRGRDGANGIAQGTVNLATTPANIVTVAVGASGAGGPNAVADFLRATYNRGCTNSVITLQKAAGSAPPSGAFDFTVMGSPTLINNESPNTTTYANVTGASTLEVVYSSAGGWKTMDLTTINPWQYFIRVLETRPLPTISVAKKRICSGDNTSFTITSNNPNQDFAGNASDYEWRWRKYKDGTIRTSPIPAWTNGTGAGANTIAPTNATSDTITYLIAARVKDKCCGWSGWVYDSVVVFPPISPNNTFTVCAGSPASGSDVCLTSASPLCVNAPSGGSTYSFITIFYRYSTDNGTSWSAWSTTRPTNITKAIGTTIVQTMSAIGSSISVVGLGNCDTAYSITQITWNINDTVNANAALVDVSGCGNPNATATLQAASPAVGSGQWTLVTSSAGVTSNPAMPTSTLDVSVDIPFGGSATYKWKVVNGGCSDSISIPITAPSVSNTIITDNSDLCYTCPIQNGNTYTYYDYEGKIICTIEDLTGGAYSASALGETEVCTHINTYTPRTWTTAYPSDSMPYLQRWWSVSPEFPLGRHARVTLYFKAPEYASLLAKADGGSYNFASINELRVSKFPGGGGGTYSGPNGSTTIHTPGGQMLPAGQGYYGGNATWTTPVFSTYAGNGTDYQVQFIVDTFSTFYIHPVRFPYEVLPVELVSFTGIHIGDKNRLDWMTVSEKNTFRFVVEKSLDGINWFYVGEKPAAGNSATTLRYDLFDYYPVAGNNYYRLKMIDMDSTFEYSNIINIPIATSNITGIIGVFPNPTSQDITILISSSSSQNAAIAIYDVLGKVVKTTTVSLLTGVNSNTLNLSSLANAAYMLVLTDKNGTEYKYKIVKQ